MKNDTTSTVLNFVLAVLVILGVVFAGFDITRQRKLRFLSAGATLANNNIMRVNSLVNDVAAFNKTANAPELTKAIATLQAKAAAAPVKAPAQK
jgi:hypothetical protein